MNRREAVGSVALLLGGTILGAEFFISGCKPGNHADSVADLFKDETTLFLNEIGETILPETSTPGAKAANVGLFMAVMVRDCYTPKDQQIFLDGLKKLNNAANKKSGADFLKLSAADRTALLNDLDKEQKEYTKAKKATDPNHYFRMIKELTLLGYFTSEVGATKALRYLPVPGKYDGNYPYKKGDKAWALA
jgi:hypothetical protein